jgi:hypothetical protein
MENGGDEHGIHEIAQIGEELVVYSDSMVINEPPQPVEEIRLQWLDGSTNTIQMRRSPGWQPSMPEGMAEEFYKAIQGMLRQLFNGDKSVGLEVVMCVDGTVFDVV